MTVLSKAYKLLKAAHNAKRNKTTPPMVGKKPLEVIEALLKQQKLGQPSPKKNAPSPKPKTPIEEIQAAYTAIQGMRRTELPENRPELITVPVRKIATPEMALIALTTPDLAEKYIEILHEASQHPVTIPGQEKQVPMLSIHQTTVLTPEEIEQIFKKKLSSGKSSGETVISVLHTKCQPTENQPLTPEQYIAGDSLILIKDMARSIGIRIPILLPKELEKHIREKTEQKLHDQFLKMKAKFR